jgi:chemotaxis protein MotA
MAAKAGGGKPDLATCGGLLLALVGIIGGLILEGGELKDISQVTAALIVLGGTFGAVLVHMPLRVVRGGLARLKEVFFEAGSDPAEVIEQIIDFASRARRNGLVSLEDEANTIADPFLRKALMLAVDGTDLDITLTEQRAEAEAKVFESAGGYAPTVGIIGAVMGLIQVMKDLTNIDKVGHGIAVAFVATVYGVAVANLFFLPAANKIKARAQEEARRKELILEGVSGIVEGLNPKLIRSKLEAFAPPGTGAKGAAAARMAAREA